MRSFCLFYFWLTVVLILIDFFIVTTAQYPRTKTFSLQMDFVGIFIHIIMLGWVGIALWVA